MNKDTLYIDSITQDSKHNKPKPNPNNYEIWLYFYHAKKFKIYFFTNLTKVNTFNYDKDKKAPLQK